MKRYGPSSGVAAAQVLYYRRDVGAGLRELTKAEAVCVVLALLNTVRAELKCQHILALLLFPRQGLFYVSSAILELTLGPGWPGIRRDPPASASCVLGLKACITTQLLFLYYILFPDFEIAMVPGALFVYLFK